MAASALGGLRVVDFSNVRTGAQVSQVLADFGAEVVHVEPPGGSALRSDAAWPCWARGKQSIRLDLRDPTEREVAQRLGAGSDVVIVTFRPGVAERLGVGYDDLARDNPRLVYASVTGFGQQGPLADLQGYEGIVLAKFGALWSLRTMTDRPGPSFPSAAYCSYPASQLALQGILAALYERESSGRGQRVETSLAQGLTVHDTFQWFSRVVASRFPDAFSQAPQSTNGIPSGGLSFRLLIALTADGRWLQFSQTSPRLFKAMMEMFGLQWMFDDPVWNTAPDFDDVDRRVAFWEKMLGAVRSKTLDQWHAEFDRHPDVWAELFRRGTELLDHPQMLWNEMVAELDDPERGRVRQPGPLVRMDRTPAALGRPAPLLGQYDDELRMRGSATGPTTAADDEDDAARPGPPLEGVTVVELGTYYAAPYGATLLAELGARVIKLEQPDGDPHRSMLPFPEVAGLKVLQGKECVAVDLHTERGREIAHRIIRGADIVLQSFRAGVAERLGLDAATLHVLHPDLVYLSSPGYGTGGPCGHRPAFAPTIGAAAGLAWRNAGPTIPERADLTVDVVKTTAMRLAAAVMGVGNADGFSAVSAGTALLLGLVACQRGAGGQAMLTTMLSSASHALSEAMVEYVDQPPAPTADPGLHGFHALYRLYETADGWVFLAAPSQREWEHLTDVLDVGAALAGDERFATVASRADDDALVDALSAVFRSEPAETWERDLRAADVACVVAVDAPVEAQFLDQGAPGRECGFVTSGHHPLLAEIPRLAPLVRFSRSSTVAGDAGLVGQHTHAVLAEHGYSDDDLEALAKDGIVVMAP